MNKIFTSLLILFFCLKSFATEKNYNISITVKGMENQMGLLAYYYGDKKYIKDTLNFDNKGVTQIKGNKDIPKGVYLIAFPSMRYSSFDLIIAENAFSIVTDTFNFIKNAIVKNSIENKQMFDDMKYMAPLGLQNDSLQKELKKYKKEDASYSIVKDKIENISKKIVQHRKEVVSKYPNTFYSKLIGLMMDIEIPKAPKNTNGTLDSFYDFHYTQQHYFDNIDFADSGLIRSPIFAGKISRYMDSYVYPQPDSLNAAVDFIIKKSRVNKDMYQFCVNELFMKYAKSEIMGQEAVYVHIADKYFLSGEAWWPTEKSLMELRDRVEALRPTLIGSIAPNFMVQDSLGNNKQFHQFVTKNKYTILVFWNSDCGHCQHEIPALKKVYEDSLRTLGVGVFAVSTEQTDSTFRAFAAKNCSNDWATCADMRGTSAFRREYDVIATPKVFIITPDYKIIAKSIPVDKLVDFIQFQDNLLSKEKKKN